MATTKTVTIKLGSFTRHVTKANDDQQAVVDQCLKIAAEQNLVIVVKRDYTGRWQGFAKRRNPRGARHSGDYEFLPTGRRAKRIDLKCQGGKVYLVDARAIEGPIEGIEITKPKR